MEEGILWEIKRDITDDNRVSFQEHIKILIVPSAKNRPSKYTKKNMTEMKSEIENSTIFGDVNIFPSIIDINRHKFSKDS